MDWASAEAASNSAARESTGGGETSASLLHLRHRHRRRRSGAARSATGPSRGRSDMRRRAVHPAVGREALELGGQNTSSAGPAAPATSAPERRSGGAEAGRRCRPVPSRRHRERGREGQDPENAHARQEAETEGRGRYAVRLGRDAVGVSLLVIRVHARAPPRNRGRGRAGAAGRRFARRGQPHAADRERESIRDPRMPFERRAARRRLTGANTRSPRPGQQPRIAVGLPREKQQEWQQEVEEQERQADPAPAAPEAREVPGDLLGQVAGPDDQVLEKFT
jgi:hypothetical protein